ncbi:MAG: DinB family protein [Thermoanaerobaculia bacterium]
MSELSNLAASSVAEARAYIDAILGMLGDRDPWRVLEETPDEVARRVEDLDEATLRRPEAPGKWSLIQVVQHLADSEIVWGWRLRMVIAQDRPAITGFDQDLWAERLGYDQTSLADALQQLRLLRRLNLRIVRAVPEPERHLRVGIHAERGEETLAHMIRLEAGHDLAHLRQLDRIRQAV